MAGMEPPAAPIAYHEIEVLMMTKSFCVHISPETLASADPIRYIASLGMPLDTCVVRLSFPVKPWTDVPAQRSNQPNPGKGRRLAFFDSVVACLQDVCSPGPKIIQVTGFWPHYSVAPARTTPAFDDGIARLNVVNVPTAPIHEAYDEANLVPILDRPHLLIKALRGQERVKEVGTMPSFFHIIPWIFGVGWYGPVDPRVGEIYLTVRKLRPLDACPMCNRLLSSATPASPNLRQDLVTRDFDRASYGLTLDPPMHFYGVCRQGEKMPGRDPH